MAAAFPVTIPEFLANGDSGPGLYSFLMWSAREKPRPGRFVAHFFPDVLRSVRLVYYGPQVQFQVRVRVRVAVGEITSVPSVRKLLQNHNIMTDVHNMYLQNQAK